VWVDAYLRGVFEKGKRVAIEVFAIDVTARVVEERERRAKLQSEVEAQRLVLRQIVDDLEDLVYRATADGTITFANRAYAAYIGDDDLVGRNVFELIRPPHLGDMKQDLAALTPEQPVLHVPPVQGRSDRVLEWTLRGFFDADRQLTEFQCTAHDVTELQQALEKGEVLLREVHHRVKNNLQVISSLLAVQFEEFADPAVQEAIQKTEARIRTLSLAHEALHRSPNLSRVDTNAYVQRLLDTLRDVFGVSDRHVRVIADLEPVEMDLDTAMRCGSIINELVSNAFKHAFDKRGGTVRVQLSRQGGHTVLVVADDGKGLPKNAMTPPIKTLGLELVRQLCAHLHATITVRREKGTRFEIVFPSNGGA